MKRLQAFKFVLLPNGAQQRDMRRFAGSCRFVFNRALALQQANYQAGERFIGYLAMAKVRRRRTDFAILGALPH
jgi:putative transposase